MPQYISFFLEIFNKFDTGPAEPALCPGCTGFHCMAAVDSEARHPLSLA